MQLIYLPAAVDDGLLFLPSVDDATRTHRFAAAYVELRARLIDGAQAAVPSIFGTRTVGDLMIEIDDCCWLVASGWTSCRLQR